MAEAQEGVTYEMLQDLLRAERRSNKLMPVPPRFWPDVRAFLQKLLDEFRTEQAKDPFGRRVMLLTDTVKNARAAAESLWALRERKLAMLALASQKDRKKPDGLLPDEGQLYQRLAEVLDEARGRVVTPFELLSGNIAPAVKAEAATAAMPQTQPAAQAAAPDRPESFREPSAIATHVAPAPVVVPSDTEAPSELVTIKALSDIPPFVGPDMQTYLLKAGDIASVPPSIAQLLERRKKAAIVEGM